MTSENETDGPWERVASELRACREAQQRTWGDIDNATLGRYLAGDVTPQERRRVEAALQERPELRKLTDLVSDVLRDCEPASPPAVLPLRRTTLAPQTTAPRWRRWAAVAAAACLLFVLGYTVLPRTGPGPSAPADLAMGPDRDSGRHGAVAFHQTLPGAVPSAPARDEDKRPVNVAKDEKAPEAPGTAKATELAIPDPVVLACADGLAWAGERLERAGDVDKAEWSYNLAHKIQVWKLGPNAAPTVETRQKLGDVYQLALNTPTPFAAYAKVATPTTAPPEVARPAYSVAAKADGRTNSLNQLRERITRQAPAEVRKSVVPILVQNLREAQTPQAREQLGQALAELGPAANDAVPALEDCLAKAQTPEERAAVLRALGEMGPAAGANAAPVLVTSLKSPSPVVRRAAEEALIQYGPAARDALDRLKEADGSPAERTEWENVKKRVLGAEGHIGVRDAAELFSPLVLKEGRRALHELARDYNVQAFTETVSAADDKEIKDRAREVVPNGVCLVIRRAPVRVEVYVGRGLLERGFDQKQQDQLRQVVEADVDRHDYDQGLLDGVRFITRFQAERAKDARP